MAKVDDPGVSTSTEGPLGRGKRSLEGAQATFDAKRRTRTQPGRRPPTTVDAEVNYADKSYVDAYRKRKRSTTGRAARR